MNARYLFLVALLSAVHSSYSAAQSIWSPKREIAPSLFADNKARDIGDTLTIIIVENTSAKEDRNTSTSQEVDWSGKITRLMYPNILRHQDRKTDGSKNSYMPEWAWNAGRDFEGGGSINNKQSVSARIGVRVIDVLPNRNLVIEGTRSVLVADQEQKMVLTGVVRPTDIRHDNTVLSTQVADASIVFHGEGTLSSNQRKGWITRVLEWINPL